MTDYAVFQVGQEVYPLTTTSGNTLLQDADAALFYMLDFWKSMLVQHVGARLVSELAAAGVTTSGHPITSAVMMVAPYDPAPYMVGNQLAFPLLAVYRKSVTTEWREVGFERDVSTFGATFVLPPLTAGQAEKIVPILGSVYKVLRARTTQGYDPNYTPPGGATGGLPWTAPFANLEEIGVSSARIGEFSGEGNLHFPTLIFEARCIERDNPPSQAVQPLSVLAGVDVTTSIVASDGTSFAGPSNVTTNPAPTITSLSVTTGSQAGGTAVTITGTGFTPGWVGSRNGSGAVLFGNTPATSVVVVSATSITCVTPAMLGGGTVTVSVLNGDAQFASLPAAFTFTTP